MDDEDDAIALTSLLLGGRAAFFPAGTSTSMPGIYLLGQGSLWRMWHNSDGDDESETDFTAGFGMGYQWRIGPAFVLRMEGQYGRWFDEELNSFSLVLGFGTRL